MTVVKAHHPQKGQLVKVIWNDAEVAAFVARLEQDGWLPGLR